MRSRERLRVCQERVRSAEVAELEARLALDAIREQVLVELAGLGDLGLRLLVGRGRPGRSEDEARRRPAGPVPEPSQDGADGRVRRRGRRSEEALERLLAGPPSLGGGARPSSRRRPAGWPTLRRRFHELGAPNPFAAEEYETVKTRLDGLEAQRSDLIDGHRQDAGR